MMLIHLLHNFYAHHLYYCYYYNTSTDVQTLYMYILLQVYVHDLSSEVVSITRHNPQTHQSFICVVRSAFNNGGDNHPHCDSLTFEGK